MLKRLAFITTVLCTFAVVSIAANLTEAPGGKLNGQAPGDLPETLSPGDLVTGPATVKTASGDTLVLGAGSVLEVQSPDGEKEFFFLKKGSLRGTIGDRTTVAIPTGWLGVGEGQTAEFYARTIDAVRGSVQVRSGTAALVYRPVDNGYPEYAMLLTAGQGIEVWSPSPGNIAWLTDQNNPGDVVLSGQVTGATEVKLSVPKATAGAMVQEEGGLKTRVASEGGSWKGGLTRGEIRVESDLRDNAVLGPGAFVLIDNITGKVLTYDEVDFEIIAREISLTSEFTSTATSNFFGLGD